MRKSIYTLVVLFTLALSSFAFAEEAAPVKAGVVNINTADAAQLSLLPRVGEKAAQRIIAYRTEHGPFKKTSELMEVKGFGEKTFEGLAPYISLSGATTLTVKVKSPRKPRANKSATPAAS